MNIAAKKGNKVRDTGVVNLKDVHMALESLVDDSCVSIIRLKRPIKFLIRYCY